MYTAGVFAKKAGVTLKTIHHYDKAGLLTPSGYSQAGYRLYTDLDFERLQKILTLKFLGFSLDEIKQIITKESDYDTVRQSLMVQRTILSQKMKQIDLVKEAIDKTIGLDEFDAMYWQQFIQIIEMVTDKNLSLEQYENSSNLCDRIYLHDAFSENKMGWHRWFFQQLGLNDHVKVLELGCGNASLWKRNKDKLPHHCEITLTDLSEGMLEDAKLNLRGYTHLFNFQVMDAQTLLFEDNSFDVVIADHLLYLLENREQAFAEMKRVLKPGGQIFATTLGQNHMLELKHLVQNFDDSLYLSKQNYDEEFGLENGSEQLAPYFTNLQTTIYDDCLNVTEPSAIINYVLSSPGNVKKSLTGDRLTLFKKYVLEQFKTKPSFSIHKATGLITGIKPKAKPEFKTHDSCLICERIELIKQHRNPYFVAELETGYVVIGDHQYFNGYTLFLCKQHATELHFLEADFRLKFLQEMSLVAEAVYAAFSPEKLNYELLGNGDSHLHWHLFPRCEADGVKGPVWWLERDKMFAEEVKPDYETLEQMKQKLTIELKKLTSII